MTTKKAILLAFLTVLAAAPPAFAQRWGRSGFPREGACFFKHPDFEGDYFCARNGENVGAVPDDMNDKISSIKVFGDVEVRVYKDIRFAGRSSRFEYDVRNLKNDGWNDLISSFQVRGTRGGGSGYGSSRPSNRPSSGDVDRVVRRAYQDVLEREPDQQGLRTYRSHMLDDGWSEQDVREALRKSPEFREKSTMTYPKAQDIVRRAYQNVLRREPDAGAQGYVSRVMRDHWTQQDVERELRKSAEYRNKGQ